MGAHQYIIQGFYPNGCEFRVEVAAYSPTDVMILAQGALKSSTLKATYVIDTETGDKIPFYSNHPTLF